MVFGSFGLFLVVVFSLFAFVFQSVEGFSKMNFFVRRQVNLKKIVNILQMSSSSTPKTGFNQKIDLSSEKVVHNLEVSEGQKIVVCRCWQSAKFPYCDGSHNAYNKEHNDNLGPAIVQVKKQA